MPYRDSRDALRERIEWLEGELDRLCRERDRVAAVERELADARERLARIEGAQQNHARKWPRWALALGGTVVLGGLAFVVGRRPAPASAPPVAHLEPFPAEVQLDPPQGWTRTIEEEWTHFTSPDQKARIWVTVTNDKSAVPARYGATNALCKGESQWKPEEHREIGPDHLRAYYYEGTCEPATAAATMLSMDVLFARPEPYDPNRGPSTAHARDLSRLVLVSKLAKDCSEALRLEVAAVIASVRRKT